MAMVVGKQALFLLFVLGLAALPPTWGKIRVDVSFKVLLAYPSSPRNLMKIVGKGTAFYSWLTAAAPDMIKGYEDGYEAWTTPIGSYTLKPGKGYKYSVQCVNTLTQACQCQGPVTKFEIPGTWKSTEYNVVVFWNRGAAPCPTCNASDVCSKGGGPCYFPNTPTGSYIRSYPQPHFHHNVTVSTS